MRTLSVLVVLVAAGLGVANPTHAQPRLANPPEPIDDAGRQARQALGPQNAKIKAALAGDARVAPLTSKLLEAAKTKDKATRKRLLDGLGPQIVTVRNDALKKAAVDPSSIDKQLAVLRAPATTMLGAVAPASASSTTVTDSTFPNTYSYRGAGDLCPDSNDKWDFDGNKVKVWAQSTPLDADCWNIRAGRSTNVAVPAGTKKMKVVVNATVDLDVFATALGAGARAVGEFGVRVSAPSGAALTTVNVAGQSFSVPAKLCTLKSISAKNIIPNPLPFDTAAFTDNVQEGDANSACSFDLPANVGANVDVALWVGGMVDADLTGVATLSNEITVKSIKVTFSK